MTDEKKYVAPAQYLARRMPREELLRRRAEAQLGDDELIITDYRGEGHLCIGRTDAAIALVQEIAFDDERETR